MKTLFLIASLLILVVLIWYLPKAQLRRHRMDLLSQAEAIDLENKLRITISQILGGILLLSGIYLTYTQNVNLKIKENTELLSNSLKQLDDSNIGIRLGAVYTLDQLSQRSVEYNDIVFNIFENYIQEKSNKDSLQTERDIELMLKLIGKGKFKHRSIKLSDCRFAYIDLSGLDFSSVNFSNCRFSNCGFANSNFDSTSLNLAQFIECNLADCKFRNTELMVSKFRDCNLGRALLANSILASSDFSGCDLENSTFLKSSFGCCNVRIRGQGRGQLVEFVDCATIENSDIRFVKFENSDSTKITFTSDTVTLDHFQAPLDKYDELDLRKQ